VTGARRQRTENLPRTCCARVTLSRILVIVASSTVAEVGVCSSLSFAPAVCASTPEFHHCIPPLPMILRFPILLVLSLCFRGWDEQGQCRPPLPGRDWVHLAVFLASVSGPPEPPPRFLKRAAPRLPTARDSVTAQRSSCRIRSPYKNELHCTKGTTANDT